MSMYHDCVFLLSILPESSTCEISRELLQSLAETGMKIIIIL